MISVDNLTVEFGTRPLIADASFVINDKERVCLVGKNGAGKSTLLRIIAATANRSDKRAAQAYTGVSAGSVSIPQDTTIGYLPQVMDLHDSRSLIEEAETAFTDLHRMQQRLDAINAELAARHDYQSPDYARLIEQSTGLQERLQMLGADSCRADTERTLLGLGFSRKDFARPTGELSGGWRMRVELAKILLRRPDILLLDEPTNHLDIESIAWLETYLIQRSKSALILVSHDRAFLNNVTSRTLEINCGRVIDYKVKYDDYVRLRAERREQQLRAYQNQQKEIADIKAFIERFRYQATKANQVQSRIKQLEKIVPIEVDEVDTSSLHLRFNEPRRSGDYPLICQDVSKSYGNHCVFRNVNLTIKRGEKVAFVGKNGEGKSTLVKCIMGQIPYEGKLTLGHNTDIGYYAQNQAQLLDGELTVFDTIDRVATGEVRTRIRDILGAFMFGGEASDKKVKVLSGGERSRLAMIKLLLQPVNFLILDEPTNHLDMRTKDVLKEAIRAFKGTVIVVSHDRDFLDSLVDRLYVFGGGQVKEFLGNIYDFARLAVEEEMNGSALPRPDSPEAPNSESSPADSGRLSYQQQKEIRRRIDRLEKQVSESEHHIGELESAIRILEDRISTPQGAADAELVRKYQAFQRQLSQSMDEWEQVSQQLEQARSENI